HGRSLTREPAQTKRSLTHRGCAASFRAVRPQGAPAEMPKSEPMADGPVLLKPVGSLLDLIGKTPMVEVTRIDTGKCRLFLKLESQNPGGSIKHRIALSMIEAAEKEGYLKPGGTIVEATAGNTGLALTLVGQQKGYRILLVIPDKMSKEKIQHLRAMGADVRLTRSDVPHGHPEYY